MLILETGTNIPGSNSYASVIEADAYHSLYGNIDWSGSDIEKEVALINATNAIDLLYGQKYLSLPQYSNQNLLFPRFVFIVNRRQIIQANEIPKQLKKATFEVALMYMLGIDVYPQSNNESALKDNSIKIGDIAIVNTYARAPLAEKFPGFNKIDLILFPLLRNNNAPKNMSL